MKEISLQDVDLAVKTMAEVALANEKYFSELDSAAGDADFGVSLADGFRALNSQWDMLDRSSISSFLMKVGMIITSNVGGCSGPIWGTAFMKSGIAAKGKDTLVLTDLVEMLRNSIDGIMARGGAALGDKTLLDALAPAADKLEEWTKKDPVDILVPLQEAADKATGQIEATRGWIAQRGRQYFTGERSRGTIDPGIAAVATMMQEIVKRLKENQGKDA